MWNFVKRLYFRVILNLQELLCRPKKQKQKLKAENFYLIYLSITITFEFNAFSCIWECLSKGVVAVRKCDFWSQHSKLERQVFYSKNRLRTVIQLISVFNPTVIFCNSDWYREMGQALGVPCTNKNATAYLNCESKP